MPASGAGGVWTCGGGQSAVGWSTLPLHQPGSPGAQVPASAVGSGVIGLKGRNRTAGRRTGRRRVVKRGVVRGRTGDIAHLEPAQYFAFSSPCQVFSLFLRLRPPPLPFPPPLCSNSASLLEVDSSAAPDRFRLDSYSHRGEFIDETGVGFRLRLTSCLLSPDSLLLSSSHPQRHASPEHGPRRQLQLLFRRWPSQILSRRHPWRRSTRLPAQRLSVRLRPYLGVGQPWRLGRPRLPRRLRHRLHRRRARRTILARLGAAVQRLLRFRRRQAQSLPHRYPRWRSPGSPAQRFSLHLRSDVGLGSSRRLGGSRLPRRF